MFRVCVLLLALVGTTNVRPPTLTEGWLAQYIDSLSGLPFLTAAEALLSACVPLAWSLMTTRRGGLAKVLAELPAAGEGAGTVSHTATLQRLSLKLKVSTCGRR